ncbi:MAG: High-affinity branched-chain amino acid transport system permease protein LivH [Elusimicrobia bacterium]|nr:High-affinity branched-chain amino acid transport system permease protein LivH [Elusimicrobiota bacterium]
MSIFNTLIEQLINGLTLGAIYALVALGYTMVYGILLMINFAHSEIFMMGAFVGCAVLTLCGALPAPLAMGLAVVGAMIVCGLAALGVEKLAYAPLRKASRLAPLISAIGVSIVLQNGFFLWRDDFLGFPNVIPERHFYFGPLHFSLIQLIILFSSLILMLGLWLFVNHTRFGQAIRACSQDREAAGLMGIPVNAMISLTFFIGASLGAAGGILYSLYYGSIKYNMGFVPGIKAFTAAVLGGIGNIPGAMVGGLILGMAESLGAAFLPQASWKDVFAFGILILVLVIRPSGLLGERTAEKV